MGSRLDPAIGGIKTKNNGLEAMAKRRIYDILNQEREELMKILEENKEASHCNHIILDFVYNPGKIKTVL